MNTVDNIDKEKEKKLGRYLQDFYLRHLSITKNNWGTYIWIWRLVGKAIGALSNPAIGSLLRRLMMVEGGTTQGYIVPINRDLDYKGKAKDTVMPISMVQRAVEESSYRMIIDKCMCRDSEGGCKNYPTDLGCIMLGEASRKMVSSGIGRYATVEQTLAHLERAAQLGLVAICGWVEFESLFFGVSPQDHDRFVEICLCCPCCCLALRHMKNVMSVPGVKEVFRSVGWMAYGTEDCISCGQCIDICPMEAIEFSGEGVSVNKECIGCGLCAFKCPKQAIAMDEIEPMKGHILDYFRWFRPRING